MYHRPRSGGWILTIYQFPFAHDDGKELQNLIATAPLPWSGDIPNKDLVDLVDQVRVPPLFALPKLISVP